MTDRSESPSVDEIKVKYRTELLEKNATIRLRDEKIRKLEKEKRNRYWKDGPAWGAFTVGVISVVFLFFQIYEQRMELKILRATLNEQKSQNLIVRRTQLLSILYDVVDCPMPKNASKDWIRDKNCPLKANLRTRTEAAKAFYMIEKDQGVRAVDFRNIRLPGADLSRIQLEGANLSNANLEGASFSGALLKEVKFTGANLERADLVRADLVGAELVGADLSEAKLFRANLEKASLEWVDLWGANLTNAKLVGATFMESCLRKAVLDGADLTGTNLEGADLEEASYMSRKGKLYPEINITSFPEGFNPMANGMIDICKKNSKIQGPKDQQSKP